MNFKTFSFVVGLLGVTGQSTDVIPLSTLGDERDCSIAEEIRESVHFVITECTGIDKLPLQGEIPGEECSITTDFNRRCENPDFPMD